MFFLWCKSYIKEVVQSKGSGLVSLHLKVTPLGELFAVSKNWGSLSLVS